MFITKNHKIKWLEQRLKIYEKRFAIHNGFIHSVLLRDKKGFSIPIGQIERAWIGKNRN